MTEKNNNIKINEPVNYNYTDTPKSNPQKSKKDIIKKIMIKYKVSEEEAENILKHLKLKKENEIKTPKKLNQTSDIQQNPKKNNTSQQTINFKNQEMNKKNKTEPIHKKPNNQNNNIKHPKKTKDDLDNILSDIIPNYSDDNVIELNNVDLIYEIETDKSDTLKETFIRLIKRKQSKKFKIQALKNVSFKIKKGEKVGVIGYNGAGKSTLLNVICGIYPPNKGTVKTTGKISPLLSLGAGFDNNYSGRKNIYLNGAVLGYDKNFIEDKIDEIIEFTELEEFIDIPIKNYSSGMIAKLGFSIATAINPDILVIDEILGVGDVKFQKKSGDKMRSLMDGGATVIIVSHSTAQIRNLCDKAIWIDKGEVREIGEVNEVCDHYIKDSEKASKEQIKNIQFK